MANGSNRAIELGIDVACMQPNLFWSNNPDYNRVKTSIEYSKNNGLGMEMEVDPLVFHSAEHQKRYFLYLEQGTKYLRLISQTRMERRKSSRRTQRQSTALS